MRHFNDYELIYVYKSENCEIALNILFNKYRPLINKIIYLYGNDSLYTEDYFQEGIITLYKSVLSFQEKFNKTFTRYFELIFRRRVLYLQRIRHKYELHEDFQIYSDNKKEIDIDLKNLTSFEKVIFQKYFIENQKISFIANNENKTVKQIYNTIYRIRNKYHNNML